MVVARELEARRGRPVVPVFWVASDDHDFAEVRSATVVDTAGALRTLRYDPREEPIGRPAWDITLDETVGGLVDELARALPAALGRDETLEIVASCYRAGETLSSAFARLVSRLLPELVVLDPADAELKRLAVPVLPASSAKARRARSSLEAGQALLEAGYHQQVPVRPGFLNVFAVVDGQRRALAIANGTVEVRGTRERWPIADAQKRLEADRARGARARSCGPLVQDALLPTAAYVAGPAEIAYHAQIGPSYAHFGIPRPVLLPRPEPDARRAGAGARARGRAAALGDLAGDPERLVARWAREDYPDVEAAFAGVREAIERELGDVEAVLGAHDPTLRLGDGGDARPRAPPGGRAPREGAARAQEARPGPRRPPAPGARRAAAGRLAAGARASASSRSWPATARGGAGAGASACTPFARGHQVVWL